MKIENKVALVTGGADGIGKAVSQCLLEKGAKTLVRLCYLFRIEVLYCNLKFATSGNQFRSFNVSRPTYTQGKAGLFISKLRGVHFFSILFVAILDINEDLGKETVNKFSEKFGSNKVRFIHCNVADDKKLKECFQEAFDVFGTLDIVVNNAGVATANHRRAIEINLIAVINGCFYAEELMTKQKREEKGVIVNTASMAGLMTGAAYVNSNYYAAKHGVVGLTKSLPISSDEFSKDLRVAAICPALVLTSIFKSQDVMDDEKMKKCVESSLEYEVK
ncbi:putative 15-hydroxyprostaglandin dehydrogenase [Apostichopus japonicus]|uniref:15-hydroxyprostaglandin dehydrogenase [NAD(+)] n=1 Tax=Stichopus japonicus TaxID=307972 RepID=A0A2G8JY54_STIJA|nr:putative 15-hydroxyprostaglandin dehydrogenase [Apostichopus japonicus]